MTKKEQEELVKRVSLKWRLSKAPTLDDVTVMLEKSIINKEEAKNMLFNEEVEEKVDKKTAALKEQVKFLQDVIEALKEHRHTTITYIPTYPAYWYWPVTTTTPTWVNVTSGGNTFATNYVGSGGMTGTAISTGSGMGGGQYANNSSTYSVNTATLIG